MRTYLEAPQFGTSMHYPSCIDRRCTGCMPPIQLDTRPAIGVCGYGRCGSTMVMEMLDAGGLKPADGSAPGTYELPHFTAARNIPLAGRAVKMLDAALHYGIPAAPAWRFVWLDRDPIEQAKSMVKFMSHFAADEGELAPDAVERLARSFDQDRPRLLGMLRQRGEVTVLQYERVLAQPRKAAKRLREVFPALDVAAAAAIVHDRDGKCRGDLAVELARTASRPYSSTSEAGEATR